MTACKCKATGCALAAILVFLPTRLAADAQALTVVPVNIFLQPGQKATTLTVTNQGSSKTAVQIRAYAWSQHDGEDQLTHSEEVVISPPIASIAPGANQVVRLVLRTSAQDADREATYRVLIDQIPPPAEPGIVHVVIRLSIPIFSEPMKHAVPDVHFHVEIKAGEAVLVADNSGSRHDVVRDIELSTGDGRTLKAVPGLSPYVLASASRRWTIAAQGPLPLPGETLKLTAHSDTGEIEQQVRVVSNP
jgi:fimbrial chaperone protein